MGWLVLLRIAMVCAAIVWICNSLWDRYRTSVTVDPDYFLQIAAVKDDGFVNGDHLAGTHRLRMKSFTTVDGQRWLVGCVPCYSTWTYVAVKDGVAYGLNGMTRSLVARMQVLENGRTIYVKDGRSLTQNQKLIDAVLAQPFCAIPNDVTIVTRLVRARAFGECLN